jgi:hypothetical protein
MAPLPLADWRDFFVMIGTASGVIVGATFVVATLAGELKNRAIGMRGFITPTVVHLGSVLVGSAVLAVPTLTPLSLALLLGAGGLAGAVYSVIVALRIWHLGLGLDDRLFYALLPIAIYVAMAVAAVMVFWRVTETFEILAVALVVLLIVGMRNAWDMANFMITRERGTE